MRLALEVSFMAKNLGSVYMYKMIEKIYFVKVKNFVVFIALTLVLVVGGCSDSDSISDSPKTQDYLESLGLKDFCWYGLKASLCFWDHRWNPLLITIF